MSSSISTFLDYQVYANNTTKSLSRVASEASVKSAQSYYSANIGKVTSVNDFIGNYKLFSYAMKAAGLDDMTYAKAFMRKVLTSDLSDSSSFVNKLTDTRFKAFAQQFSFNTSGGVTATATTQSSTQESNTVALYTAKTGTSSVSGLLATAYYQENIGNVKSTKDLESDPQLLDYVMTAYGLDTSQIDNGTWAQYTGGLSQITSVLESNPSDPSSAANQMAAGNLDTSDIPVAVQSATSQASTVSAYTNTYGRTTDAIYYENNISSVHTIDAFLSDSTLVSVAEKAYGLDTSTYSTSDLKNILTSNLDDPMSVANQLGSSAIALAKAFNFTTSSSNTSPYTQIAQDFNFDSSGNATSTLSTQSTASISGTETLYMAKAKSDTASQTAAKAETTYYNSAIASVSTLDGLLSNSRLTSYIKTAYGLSSTTSNDTLRQILTSDITNSTSVANTMGSSARKLAAAFNFSTSGAVTRNTGVAQSTKSVQMMNDAYLEQTMEDEAGDDNEGVKLALYFQRKVTSGAVSNAYSILADSALLKVVQTALNIPSSSGNEDIDLQATQITNRLNLSSLQDPAKLKSFISQFATLYDLSNSSTDTSDVTTLFGSS